MRPGFFLMILAAFGLLAAGAASAQPRREPGVLPLDRILPGIRATHPGEFYDADGPIPGPGGSEHYHLKWMTPDGRIEWLDADARTGRVVGAAPGRDAFDGPGPRRFFAPAPSFPTPPDFGQRREYRGFGPWRGQGRGGYGGGRDRRER